jgi:hypothetical protein
VGAQVSDGRGVLTSGLDASDSVLCVSARGAARHLHDQRRRKRARAAAEDHQIRGHFPTDEAATKLVWLALRDITAKWECGGIHWKTAMNQFAILYEGRFTKPAVE